MLPHNVFTATALCTDFHKIPIMFVTSHSTLQSTNILLSVGQLHPSKRFKKPLASGRRLNENSSGYFLVACLFSTFRDPFQPPEMHFTAAQWIGDEQTIKGVQCRRWTIKRQDAVLQKPRYWLEISERRLFTIFKS